MYYMYHISGAVKRVEIKDIGGADLFSETLDYEDCGLPGCKPQYNGNISRMVHEMAYSDGSYSGSRDVQYVYDELNRLSKVKDSKQPMFDEMFEYDVQGRIVAQHRAKKTDGQYALNEHPTGGEYTYESGTNRLKSVAANMGGESADNRNMSDPDNFVYDSEGNLTEDKSKRLKISYDWRGMPVEFKQTAMPQGSTDNELYKLEMKYDGSGRRVSKTVWRKAVGAENWQKKQVTHYTGIGTEIRENYHNESLEKAKVVVNMPEGLGRYGIEDAKGPDIGFGAGYILNVKFEWYLKNHLGSTMLVYGTEGNATSDPFTLGTPLAAYDYRAFGEQLTLLPAGDKFTENFTGKERDDEIALNYFGARYLDPMLGLWISVDPKRQFDSPYLYAGNGYNPVNAIDPDGNITIGNFKFTLVGSVTPIIKTAAKCTGYGMMAYLGAKAFFVWKEIDTENKIANQERTSLTASMSKNQQSGFYQGVGVNSLNLAASTMEMGVGAASPVEGGIANHTPTYSDFPSRFWDSILDDFAPVVDYIRDKFMDGDSQSNNLQGSDE